MSTNKTIKEIDDSLPNGFHDALLEGISIDFVAKTAKLDLQIDLSDADEAQGKEESYKKAILHFEDVFYFVIEAPDSSSEFSTGQPLRIDACR